MLESLAVCCVLLAATPRPVAAEWHFIPMAGITFKGNTSLVDVEAATSSVHPNFGGAVALLGDGVLGAEAIFVMTPGFFERGSLNLVEKSRSLAVMGNAVLTLPRRLTEYSLRPYVSGGFGLVRASVETGVFPVASNLTGFNIGGALSGFCALARAFASTCATTAASIKASPRGCRSAACICAT